MALLSVIRRWYFCEDTPIRENEWWTLGLRDVMDCSQLTGFEPPPRTAFAQRSMLPDVTTSFVFPPLKP